MDERLDGAWTPRLRTPIGWTSVSFLSFCSRLVAKRLLVSYNRREENRRRILIVGANERAVRIARQFEKEQELGGQVIGFVDDTAIHAPNFEEFGYHLVAKYKDLAAAGLREIQRGLASPPGQRSSWYLGSVAGRLQRPQFI